MDGVEVESVKGGVDEKCGKGWVIVDQSISYDPAVMRNVRNKT